MDVKYNTDTKIEDNSRAFKLQKANFDKEVNTAVSNMKLFVNGPSRLIFIYLYRPFNQHTFIVYYRKPIIAENVVFSLSLSKN